MEPVERSGRQKGSDRQTSHKRRQRPKENLTSCLLYRQRSSARESEKVQAEQCWRRLVALRQRRRKGTAGAATAINNLGVLLVTVSERDSIQAAEGRTLLKVCGPCSEELLIYCGGTTT